MSNLSAAQPDHIDMNFLKQIIESGCHYKDSEIRELIISPMSCGNGENYCSDMYEATIKFQSSDGEVHTQLLAIKCVAKQKQATLKQLDIYEREKYFYGSIIPQIQALIMSSNSQWIFGPRLWHATSDPIDALVMENLIPLGFKAQSRQDGLDEAHSIMALKKLAEYHALSYALTEDSNQLAAIKERYPCGLVNKASCKSKSFQALFKTQLLRLTDIFEKDAGFEDIAKTLTVYCKHFEENVTSCVHALLGAVNVLNHGDVWVNNLLFRHSVDGKEPLEVRFIDFQLSFYGSLGYDVNYLLNTSVQLPCLRDQRETLIDAYVHAFLCTLRRLPTGSRQPTAEEIVHEIHSKESYGFFVAYAFLPLMCMNQVDSQDNSLENLSDPEFAKRKIDLMFSGNTRALSTLKLSARRLMSLGLL